MLIVYSHDRTLRLYDKEIKITELVCLMTTKILNITFESPILTDYLHKTHKRTLNKFQTAIFYLN